MKGKDSVNDIFRREEMNDEQLAALCWAAAYIHKHPDTPTRILDSQELGLLLAETVAEGMIDHTADQLPLDEYIDNAVNSE